MIIPTSTHWCPGLNDIVFKTVQNLSEDLRKPKWRFNDNYLAGHCYVVSEVIYHLSGKMIWKPMVVNHEGGTHWFLKSRIDDSILDVTSSQFYSPVPYDQARGCGFLTKSPSKRARKLIRKMGYACPNYNNC